MGKRCDSIVAWSKLSQAVSSASDALELHEPRTSALPMNLSLVAADVRRLNLLVPNEIRASSRRLLQFQRAASSGASRMPPECGRPRPQQRHKPSRALPGS
jgi:hypothetical protein